MQINCVDKETSMQLDPKTFIDIIENIPLVAVDLIVYRPNGDILLGYRKNKPAKNTWFVPGGRIFKDEHIAEALQRVAKTELGLDLKPDQAKFKGVYEHMYSDNFLGLSGINTHYVVLAHEIRVNNEFRTNSDDQHAMLKWWSVAELLAEANVHPNTKAYFKPV
jgi:colanic acid biosynthesis protein WcaH